METRAQYLLIGSFVLVLVAFAVAFSIWLAKFDTRVYGIYEIHFTESVAGLSVGNSVRYKGVAVGDVRRINIAPTHADRVVVRVKIDSAVPIKQDTMAMLESVGLTGVAFVQLDGGSPGSPALKAKPGESYPVITSRLSAIQEVFSGAPDLLNAATVAVSRIGQLLDADNQAQVTAILRNVNMVTSALANKSADIEALAGNLNDAVVDFRAAAQAFADFSQSASGFLDADAKAALTDARNAMQSAQRLTQDLRAVVDENRAGLQQFTSTGLADATRLIAELRQFARAATAVAEKLERDPAAILSNQKVPEYDAAQ